MIVSCLSIELPKCNRIWLFRELSQSSTLREHMQSNNLIGVDKNELPKTIHRNYQSLKTE